MRELGVLTLEEYIRCTTSAPAACFRLAERGVLRQGYLADLVLFDPDTVVDRATFEEPMQCPVGIGMVIVNGEVVVDNCRHTGVTPGRALP